MIKMTRKKVDSLFEDITHNLYDRYIEECLTIHDKIKGNKKIDYILFEKIRTRLLIEFGILSTELSKKTITINRGTDDDKKGETKVKKRSPKTGAASAKKLVSAKKK